MSSNITIELSADAHDDDDGPIFMSLLRIQKLLKTCRCARMPVSILHTEASMCRYLDPPPSYWLDCCSSRGTPSHARVHTQAGLT